MVSVEFLYAQGIDCNIPWHPSVLCEHLRTCVVQVSPLLTVTWLNLIGFNANLGKIYNTECSKYALSTNQSSEEETEQHWKTTS